MTTPEPQSAVPVEPLTAIEINRQHRPRPTGYPGEHSDDCTCGVDQWPCPVRTALLATLDAARSSAPVSVAALAEALQRTGIGFDEAFGDTSQSDAAAILAALPVPDAPTAREGLDLPDRIVVGANGAYWRDYGDHYSMAVVSDDNDPVEIVAIYNRQEADATAWDRGFKAGLDAARPSAATLRATPTGIDPERLGTAMSEAWPADEQLVDDSEVWHRFAPLVIAEYDRLVREATHAR
jgi:hypothetical protein